MVTKKPSFYESKEFTDFLKEHNLKVDLSSLPDFHEVLSMLGTDSEKEAMEIIRDLASTKEGIDFVKNYLNSNYHIKVEDDKETTTVYPPQKESESVWSKTLRWLGLSQSTKVNSAKTDLDIMAKVVPAQAQNRAIYAWKFIKPVSRSASVPIHPPFKILGNQYESEILLKPQAYETIELPVLRLTQQELKDLERQKQFLINPKLFAPPSPELKRNFILDSQPVRLTSHDLVTGTIFTADPQDVSKVTKHLSEPIEQQPQQKD